MYLRDLSVTTPRKSRNAFGHNGIVPGIIELYLSCLGKFNSGKFTKAIIEVDQVISDPSFDEMGDVIQVCKVFDFEKYLRESLFGKRKMVLDVLQSGLLSIAISDDWDQELLNTAYKCCLSKNLEYNVLYKGKFWRAPNHKLYAGVYSCWEVERFEAYTIFLDKDKNEIYRTKLMESEYWNLQPFGKVNWSDNSNEFFVFSKDGRKSWNTVFKN